MALENTGKFGPFTNSDSLKGEVQTVVFFKTLQVILMCSQD